MPCQNWAVQLLRALESDGKLYKPARPVGAQPGTSIQDTGRPSRAFYGSLKEYSISNELSFVLGSRCKKEQ